jgi:uncharacterized protein (DUF924 family)
MNPRALVEFWCSERCRPLWFEKNEAFDDELRQQFASWIEPAAEGKLAHWEETPETALALVLLLDQFPRNIHRGSPRAYRCDPAARQVAARSIARGHDKGTPLDRRFFFYLPYEHSEDLADQQRSLALFRAWADAHDGEARAQAMDQLRYVARHEEIIRRFGRFPHRNAILGRVSTPDEIEFLKEPMSSF